MTMRLQGYPSPGDGLRLHLNENTGGCSPRVLEAIRRVHASDVSTYPQYREAVAAVAKHFNVDPEWVLLTNGLDDAGHLVPWNEGVTWRELAMMQVDVCAANPASPKADPHLPGAKVRNRNLFNPKVLRPVVNDCTHYPRMGG